MRGFAIALTSLMVATSVVEHVAHAKDEVRGARGLAQAPAKWVPSRLPDGSPDLQGIWDFRSATPLERPAQFAGREFMTEAEVADYERRAAEREDGRPPDDPRSEPSVHPVWWLDYGKHVVKTRRTSLIVEPADGRIPPLSEEGQRRLAARRVADRTHGPADSYENRTLFERCITRGLPEGMLPGPYNNNVMIVQPPGYVVLYTEMIHEARIIPLDGRPHSSEHVRGWTGDSRASWEGDTLVIDTVHFNDKVSFHGSSERLHLIERIRRLDADTIEYRFTVEDPATWTKPWTVAFPMTKSDGPMYEYACHEGNYGLANILRAARANDAKGAD